MGTRWESTGPRFLRGLYALLINWNRFAQNGALEGLGVLEPRKFLKELEGQGYAFDKFPLACGPLESSVCKWSKVSARSGRVHQFTLSVKLFVCCSGSNT